MEAWLVNKDSGERWSVAVHYDSVRCALSFGRTPSDVTPGRYEYVVTDLPQPTLGNVNLFVTEDGPC